MIIVYIYIYCRHTHWPLMQTTPSWNMLDITRSCQNWTHCVRHVKQALSIEAPTIAIPCLSWQLSGSSWLTRAWWQRSSRPCHRPLRQRMPPSCFPRTCPVEICRAHTNIHITCFALKMPSGLLAWNIVHICALVCICFIIHSRWVPGPWSARTASNRLAFTSLAVCPRKLHMQYIKNATKSCPCSGALWNGPTPVAAHVVPGAEVPQGRTQLRVSMNTGPLKT